MFDTGTGLVSGVAEVRMFFCVSDLLSVGYGHFLLNDTEVHWDRSTSTQCLLMKCSDSDRFGRDVILA
jgi:hypothetical protein